MVESNGDTQVLRPPRLRQFRARPPRGAKRPWVILASVTLLAVIIQGFNLAASRLWVQPDSAAYITLGAELAEQSNFDHELFHFRPPGYPLLLAGIFRVSGDTAAAVIPVIQHAMIVACAILVTLIAWTLWPHRGFALAVGLPAACSWHLAGYASGVLTEVPYAFALIACVYGVVHHHRRGGLWSIAIASLAAAIAALIQPAGVFLLAFCVLTALTRAIRRRRDTDDPPDEPTPIRDPGQARSHRRRRIVALALAVAPAAVVVLPVLYHHYRVHGDFRVCSAGGYLYRRTACIDHLDSHASPAMAAVRQTLAQARRVGLLRPPDATVHDFWPTVTAYRLIHGVTFADAAAAMDRAGFDLLLENPWSTARRTAAYAYRVLITPDTAYRYRPGGAPGIGALPAKGVDLFDVDTYRPLVTADVGTERMNRYLPENHDHAPASVPWNKVARWYHAHIELGPSLTALLESPYEELAWLALLGGVFALARPDRAAWLLVAGVIACHVVVSALWLGPWPRGAVPAQPLMLVFTGLFIVGLPHTLARGLRSLAHTLTRRSTPQPAPRP